MYGRPAGVYHCQQFQRSARSPRTTRTWQRFANFITETGQAYRSADKFTPNSITIGASEDAFANCSNEDHAENWAHVHVPRLA